MLSRKALAVLARAQKDEGIIHGSGRSGVGRWRWVALRMLRSRGGVPPPNRGLPGHSPDRRTAGPPARLVTVFGLPHRTWPSRPLISVADPKLYQPGIRQKMGRLEQTTLTRPRSC